MYDLITGFEPFFDGDSKVLILGSFPSVKSREQQFYYGNPHNAFWRILATFFNSPTPLTVDEKKAFLRANKIALWDIVTECEIVASRDDTIKNFKVANLSIVLQNSSVNSILINGGRAYGIYKKYCKGINLPAVKLPSTSPANTRRNEDEWYAALRTAFSRA